MAELATAKVLRDQMGRTFEVLLVDDGSRDATAAEAEAAAREDPRIRVLRHGDNRGGGQDPTDPGPRPEPAHEQPPGDERDDAGEDREQGGHPAMIAAGVR